MKPRRVFAAAIVACTVNTSFCAGHALKAQVQINSEQQPVRVIWYQAPPYAIDSHGIPTGLEIDLWRMIAETQKIPYQMNKASSFKTLLEKISTGEADIGISAIAIDEARSKRFTFSFPTNSSHLRVYSLEKKEPIIIHLLQIITSRKALAIFIGFLVIACLFAIPAWFLERQRLKATPLKIHDQLILVLQKTLLLSTDHTTHSLSRIISISSLFARVLLTAYFTGFVLELAKDQFAVTGDRPNADVRLDNLKNYTFAAIPGSIPESILSSNGVKTRSCKTRLECLTLLQQAKVDAVLEDEQAVAAATATLPTTPRIEAASGKLMPLFMGFAYSDRFKLDPRAEIIDDGLSRSYYDGTYTRLRDHWLK